MHTYNHAYTKTHKYRPTHIYTDRHMNVHAYIHIYKQIQRYTTIQFIHTYTRDTCRQTYTYKHRLIQMHIYTYIIHI